jgi:hypothetical protein
LFNRLMREILENHSKLTPKTGGAEEETERGFAASAARVLWGMRRYRVPLLIAGIAVLFLFMRVGFLFAALLSRAPRRKTALLWRHALHRLRLAGYAPPAGTPVSEFALTMDARIPGVYALYLASARARFAPSYPPDDRLIFIARYRAFDADFRRSVGAARRILSWLLPPLALALKAAL